jgi:NTE family protein
MSLQQHVDVESVVKLSWLRETLESAFGVFDEPFLQFMLQHLRWVHVKSGEVLFHQGDSRQTVYIVVSGRLRVLREDELGETHVLGDMRRGETVGEMALITGEPRTATIVAVRDSVLVSLSRSGYEQVISSYPLVSMRVAQFIIERIRPTLSKRRSWARPSTVAVIPATAGVASAEFIDRLMPCLKRHGTVLKLDATGAVQALGAKVLEQPPGDDLASADAVSHWIDRMEAEHEMVILVGDEEMTPWSEYCLRHADEVLFLADATTADRKLLDRAIPDHSPIGSMRHRTLVLVHPAQTDFPRNTAAWLASFPVDAHIHLRDGSEADLNRLARTLFGTAIGLVLGGGGARGFAHLGVLKALEEAGIPVDFVGGASVGSIMGAYSAFDTSAAKAIEFARKAFSGNPTGDLNIFPLISLIAGKRARQTVDRGIRDLAGFDANLEDSWKPFFCIASNYSRASEVVLRRGSLAKAVRASFAIPAALPPVVMDGDLMIDGGTFNNFPTDVMANQRVGFILGCDLSKGSVRKLEIDEIPSGWELMLDRFRPRQSRRYRLPALSSIILNVSIMHSQSRLKAAKATADVCFTPDCGRIGMLNWKAFDHIVELGYKHAREVLAALPEETLRRLVAEGKSA